VEVCENVVSNNLRFEVAVMLENIGVRRFVKLRYVCNDIFG
jgi:hypothetical protein